MSEGEQYDLLSYFLTNQGLPGDAKPVPMVFDTGHGGHKRTTTWQVRRISWEEWQDAMERSTDKATDLRDQYATASLVVARAMVNPTLGGTVKRLKDEAEAEPDGKLLGPDGERMEPPADAGALLRRMFRHQSGVLLELSAFVLSHSKLGQSTIGSVRSLDRDIEAGKA